MPQAQREQIEACAAAFEAAWFRDGCANLADYLPPADAAHFRDALVELACIELELGWATGERRCVEDYLAEHPALRGDAAAIAALAQQEYQLQLEAGQDVPAAEYQRRLGVEVSPVFQRRDPASIVMCQGRIKWREQVSKLYGDYKLGDNEDCLASTAASWPGTKAGPAIRLGAEIAGFRLMRELGRGTFGRVFLAEQAELAGRHVVLKVGAHLYDESQRLAQLQHTNIVPIYSAHRVDDVQVLCMPYLGSTTLADVLAAQRRDSVGSRRSNALFSTVNAHAAATVPASEGTTDITRTADVATEVKAGLAALADLPRERAVLVIAAGLAQGLAHAHSRGIVHRDLKPANILLADDGTPLLLDFNLAVDARARADQRSLLGGTLPYMAPEQLEALLDADATIDGRSDIYALGVILFELIAGRHPFSPHPGTSRESMQAMLVQRRSGPPHLQQIAASCSPAVAAIVQHCLAANPDERYANAQDLAEDLLRQLDDLPLRHTPEPSLIERTQKLVRRRPRMVGGVTAGVLAVVVAVATAAAIGQSRRAVRAEAITAREQFQSELSDARTLLSLPFPSTEELAEGRAICLQALARFGLPSAATWTAPPEFRALAPAEQAVVREELGEALLLAARGAWLQAGMAAAVSQREQEMATAKAFNVQAASFNVDPSAANYQRARMAAKTGPNAEPDDRFDVAAAAAHSPSVQASIAGELATAGRFQEACQLLEMAIRHQPANAAWWAQLGACQSALGRTRDAVASYTTCIALRPTLWRAYFWRGQAQLELKEFSQACWDLDKVLAERPGHVPSLALRALAKLGQGELDAAEADLSVAIELDPRHTRMYFMRSRVRKMRSDAAGAERDLAEGLKRQPTDELSWIARGVARLPTDAGGALADFEAALQLNPWSREAAQNKAHVLSERLGRTEEAIATLDPIVARFPDFVLARVGRGVLLARLGRREAARKDAADSLQRDSRPLVAYQCACIHALNAQAEPADATEALQLLHRALRDGFGAELIARDPDLAALHKRAEFQQLVQLTRAEKKPPPTNKK